MLSTTVHRDPDHIALSQRALDAIESGTLAWRHHGIGVLQAYISEGDGVEHRLHIWSRSLLKGGIDASGDAHDHRFRMVSHVLVGRVHHEEWLLSPNPLGPWTTMTLVHARAAGAEQKFHAPMSPTGARYFRSTRSVEVRAGDLYRFAARAFHRSPVDRFAVTWVEKREQTAEPARIAHPVDVPAVPAFGHEMDGRQVAHLTALAAELLGATVHRAGARR